MSNSEWSPAECAHCGYGIMPAEVGHELAKDVGVSPEKTPTGWVHSPVEVNHATDWCNCGDVKLSHHHAHPADNRSVEQEYHGGSEFMKTADDLFAFNEIMKNNNLGQQFD